MIKSKYRIAQGKRVLYDILENMCIELQPLKVFSLIGLRGHLVSRFPEEIEVYSAESVPNVYYEQKKRFPDYNLTNGNASKVFLKEDDFDFIWLDYYGSCTSTNNLTSMALASKSLSDSGIMIVSHNKTRKVDSGDPKAVFKDLNLKVFKTYMYTSGSNSFVVYFLEKKDVLMSITNTEEV